MNPFSLINLMIIAVNLPMAVFLFIKAKGKKSNLLLAILCLAAVAWGIGALGFSLATNEEQAMFWWQIANIGGIASTVIFYYFILSNLQIKKPVLSVLVNGMAGAFLYLNFFQKSIFLGDLKFFSISFITSSGFRARMICSCYIMCLFFAFCCFTHSSF